MPRRQTSSNRSWIMPAIGSLICIVSCPLAWSFPQLNVLAWLLWASGSVLVFAGCFRKTTHRQPGNLLTKWALTAVTSSVGYLIFFPTLK